MGVSGLASCSFAGIVRRILSLQGWSTQRVLQDQLHYDVVCARALAEALTMRLSRGSDPQTVRIWMATRAAVVASLLPESDTLWAPPGNHLSWELVARVCLAPCLPEEAGQHTAGEGCVYAVSNA